MTLVEKYETMLRESIHNDECYPMPTVIRSGETLEFASYMTDGVQIVGEMFKKVEAAPVDEVLFGLDCYTAEGQGTTLPSAVIVFHVRADAPPRIGVMEYDGGRAEPLVWDNEFWNRQYASLATRLCLKMGLRIS